MILETAKNIVDITEGKLVKEVNEEPLTSCTKGYYYNWLKFNDNWYYPKTYEEEIFFVNELLGMYLAKEFLLPTVDYQVFYRNGNYGLMSLNLCKEKADFRDDLFWKTYRDNLSHFLAKLKEDFANPDLPKQFMKIALMNYYLGQTDFNMGSLLFNGSDASNLKLLGIVDFEQIRITSGFFNPQYRNQFFFAWEIDILEAIETYHFQDCLDLFSNINLKEIFEKIENDYGITINPEIKEKSYKHTEEVYRHLLK